jgi:hypothetical protein
LRGTRLNRQYETAATLLDRQLTMIDYLGVEEFIAGKLLPDMKVLITFTR